MANGTLTIRVRPLRIAFLADPADNQGILRAVEINTALWGGAYNPIIPVLGRTPRYWEPLPTQALPKPLEIIRGYLDGFDPDIVVPIGACAARKFDVGHRELVKADDILGDPKKSMAPRLGVSIFEVLQDLLDKGFKYRRNDDLTLTFPKLPRANQLFYAAIFGRLAPAFAKRMDELIPRSVHSMRPSVTLSSYPEYLEPKYLFPRRISNHGLRNVPLHSPTLFVMDARRGLDVIDFWNLRAAGHYVVPVPIQGVNEKSVRKIACRFIDANFRPYELNESVYQSTTIQKSRYLHESVVRAFCDALKVAPPKDANRPKYLYRNWYPRLWDEWARNRVWSEGIRYPYSHEVERPIAESESRLDLRSVDPQFELERAYSGEARFVNEFQFRFHSSREPMAEVIPEGSKELSAAIGRIGYENWRFTRRGLAFIAHHAEDLVFLDIPKAESVMTEWLRERGWRVTLSTPGRMALQLFRQLGGEWGLSWLAHKGVIPLLTELENEAGMSWAAVTGKLQRIINTQGLHFSKELFLERLLERNALRLGATIQCPVCMRHNWFEMDKLKYELQCRFCLSTFAPPLKSPKEIEWTYRAHGPFAGSAAQGAFTVLLTMKFLGARDSGRLTALFSYTASKDGENDLESDLTCLYRGDHQRRIHVAHAECKSFGGFEARDFARMHQLASAFPGAALIFSTLSDELDSYSKAELTKLSLAHRRNRIRRKPYSAVIVLTARELFSMWGAPECWKDLPIYKLASRPDLNDAFLDTVADITQRIYLDLDPWHEWSQREWQKRVRRRDIRKATKADAATSPQDPNTPPP